MMGLEDEYATAREFVAGTFTLRDLYKVNVFELNIRLLGGLLSISDLSGDAMYLGKAIEVGSILLGAFTAEEGWLLPCGHLLPFGVPSPQMSDDPERRPPKCETSAGTNAEFGTLSLEFRRLSQRTGDDRWSRAVDGVDAYFEEEMARPEALPLRKDVNLKTGNMHGATTVSGGVDSTYEYFLKNHLQSGDARSKALYDTYSRRIIDAMYKSSGGYHFVSSTTSWDHLACYIGGQFILDGENLNVGLNVTDTCARMYVENPNGISCETVRFGARRVEEVHAHRYERARAGLADASTYAGHARPGEAREEKAEAPAGDGGHYGMTCVQDSWFQRPEVIESIFYAWRATKDQKWREYGAQMWAAIQRHSRVDTGGYAGLRRVRSEEPAKYDRQESFFLAETLKYFWLLFEEDDALDLDRFVLNTEAHPILRVQG